MRYFGLVGFLTMALVACSPTPPDDGEYWRKVNPTPSDLETQKAEDRLRRAEVQTVIPVTIPPATTEVSANTDTGVTTTTVISPTGQATAQPTPQSGDISNSQDFRAVSARETIASDAAKLAALKQQYEVVQPGADPTRGSGVNLAKYAVAQTNPVGQKIHKRSSLRKIGSQKKCAAYASRDEAQTDFLAAGGPAKDKLGLDPDGDGYACGWTPASYKALIGAQ